MVKALVAVSPQTYSPESKTNNLKREPKYT